MAAKKQSLVSPSQLPKQLGLEKLKRSGLTEADAKVLRMEFLGAGQTLALGHDNCPAIKIPYFGPAGRPQSSWPKHPPFYRLRLFKPAGFDEMTEGGKVMRYTQPSGGSVCAYFPQNQDWGLLLDPGSALLITEGEIKAACACKSGFPTIGLGGVQNWHSKKAGIEWLPEFDHIAWVGRHVYICFDSDYKTNPNVCTALQQIALALKERGAFPYVVTIPTVPGMDKTGLDDFLVAEGPGVLNAILHQAVPLGLTKVLFDLNDRYVYVRDPGLIINQATFTKTSPGAFTEHLESTKTYHAATVSKDGDIVFLPMSGAKAWIEWPLRREALKMTYKPGQPKFVDAEFNTWPGWGVEPKKGSIEPFKRLLDHLFTGAEPEARVWFERWLAWPLQHPGTKMFSAVVFHGNYHGTGKTLVGDTMGVIYGKNFTSIGQDDIHGSFNQWAESRQFVMGDDVTGANKREDNDRLKKLITQKEMWVNTKYIPSYTVPDCLNWFLNSNHSDAFFMEDTDRRLFIHEVLVEPLDGAFYQKYVDWLKLDGDKAHGGAQAVFDYLLHLPRGDFNPAAAAFKTAARARMIGTVQSDLGGWAHDLRDNPDHVLRVGEVPLQKDLYTNKELLMLYDPLARTKVTAQGLGRALGDVGIRQVLGGQPIKLSDGAQDRYYAVRNAHKWLRLQMHDIKKYLEEQNNPMKPAPKKAGKRF